VADVNGDGHPDIIASRWGNPAGIHWWRNDGRGGFVERFVESSAEYTVYDLAVGDMDGDGDVDFISSTSRFETTLPVPGQWWDNRAEQNFVPRPVIGCGIRYLGGIADLDGDGDADLAGGSPFSVRWCENTDEVLNGSFERGPAVPSPWRGVGLGPEDRRVRGNVNRGRHSFLIEGAPESKRLRQVVTGGGSKGDRFTLAGWSAVENPDPLGGRYGLTVTLRYADGTEDQHGVIFSYWSHDWEYREASFTAAKEYESIVVSIWYAWQKGRALFDDVRLIRRPEPASPP
jgi:hypothetical protein